MSSPILLSDAIKEHLKTYYEEKIEEIKKEKPEEYILNIDGYELKKYLTEVYNKTLIDKNSENYLYLINKASNDLVKYCNTKVETKLCNIPENAKLSSLRSLHVGKLISTKATVKYITEPIPRIIRAYFECRGCKRHQMTSVNPVKNNPTPPNLCTECGGRSFKLIHSESELEDFRYIKLEEPLNDDIINREILGIMNKSLADPKYDLKVGDDCEVVGIFKIRAKDTNNRFNKELEFIFDINNITPLESSFESMNFDTETVEKIKKLSKDPDVYQRIVKTIAPTVHGHENIKKGLVLQLFEGDISNKIQKRSAIHILLLGDPGIGKSELIKSIHKIAPKSIKINGAGVSKAGLTATVQQEKMLNNKWTAEAGALVQANQGLLIIDEFDKTHQDTMEALNDPMEDGIVDIAKAGIIKNLPSKTSILAAANPEMGKLDLYRDLNKQIRIPSTVLTRFGLIYLLEDKIDSEKDKELAEKIVNRNYEREVDGIIDENLLKSYIAYAKKNISPALHTIAKKRIVDFYTEIRSIAEGNDDVKPFTPRIISDLIRLSIARAKVELRDCVNEKDVEEAINVFKESLKTLRIPVENAGMIENVLSVNENKIIRSFEEHLNEYQFVNNLTKDEVVSIKEAVGVECDVNDKRLLDRLFNIAIEDF